MTSKHPTAEKFCALLWDESFLWGLMAWQALRAAGLPFALVRSEDIRAGIPASCAMVFVPGGWAAAKVRALGEEGQAQLRLFIENGGSYLGICGGAGMATDSHLGLLPVYRTPNDDRVPSFSGPISLDLSSHPIWHNIREPVFHAWWPPQLHVEDAKNFRILARYNEAQQDAMSSDIRVGDGREAGWPSLEKQYGILLDPHRLKGEPAVVEGACGRGKVIVSLLHFDTPGDPDGACVLQNLWRYLTASDIPARFSISPGRGFTEGDNAFTPDLGDIKAAVDHLIGEGERLLLWRRRNSLLLQWRRGVRGMEYSTLAAMTAEIVARLSAVPLTGVHQESFPSSSAPEPLKHHLQRIRALLLPFVDEALPLLQLEHEWLANGSVFTEAGADKKMTNLRRELFGTARAFGGKFKPLAEAIDSLLYRMLKSA